MVFVVAATVEPEVRSRSASMLSLPLPTLSFHTGSLSLVKKNGCHNEAWERSGYFCKGEVTPRKKQKLQ